MVMGNDPEATFIKGLKNIEGIKKEVKSLKTKQKELTAQLEMLDMIGFQSQITKLSEGIESVKQDLLNLQRLVAALKVNSDSTNFATMISSSRLSNRGTIQITCLTEAASLKQKIFTSNKPLLLAGEYNSKWAKILKGEGIDIISY